MREKAYKAYFEMQERKTFYETKKSEIRRRGNKETASEYGEKAVIVGECMSILVRQLGLTFNT
jgi:hypothetical protein